MRTCASVSEIVEQITRTIDEEKAHYPTDRGAQFFFRGERKNYDAPRSFGTHFDCFLDRHAGYVEHERDIYEDVLRLNVVSFKDDRTMCDRIARMQHYRFPTRFADISTNALLAAFFAAGGERSDSSLNDDEDGYIRILKVAKHKMKSFTSDIITAISHLPLVSAENIRVSNPGRNGLGYLTYEVKNERTGFYDFDSDPDLYQTLCAELQQVWAFKPILNNDRIRAQDGAFLAFGCRDNKAPLHPTFAPEDYENENAPSFGIKQIGFVRIAAEAKATIRKHLRHFGMSAETVYPDLENVAKVLAERYLAVQNLE